MIPLLCLYILRKLKEGNISINIHLIRRIVKLAGAFAVVLLTAVSPSLEIGTDPDNQVFRAVRKGKVIGYVHISRSVENEQIVYQVKSEIRTRIVVSLLIRSREKSIYRGDTLVYSKVLRKINNKTKIEHEMIFDSGEYRVHGKKQSERTGPAITDVNLASMLIEEPPDLGIVYSDAHNKMLPMNKLRNGEYVVTMPNGDQHRFIYAGGKCVKIEARGMFYKIKLITLDDPEEIIQGNIQNK